jgi:hypothetical protein
MRGKIVLAMNQFNKIVHFKTLYIVSILNINEFNVGLSNLHYKLFVT